jgi:tetratricopeptide (TPR) repeat protein
VEFLNAVRVRFENLPEFQYNIGMAYFGVHDYGKAAPAFRRAIELAPDMDLAHFFLGNTYAVSGELQTATREYREALRLNPRNAAYCLTLGKVLGRMDLEPEAIRWLRKALELKPGDVASEFELGRICERNGDVACARPLLEDVAARYPDLLAAHYALSRIYTKLQLTEKAVRENAQVRRILAAQPRRTATNAVPDLTEELPVPSLGPERR